MGRDTSDWARTVALATTIPMVLLVGPVLGAWVGGWVDRRWPSLAPWGSGVGVVLGLIAGGRQAWLLIRQIQATNRS